MYDNSKKIVPELLQIQTNEKIETRQLAQEIASGNKLYGGNAWAAFYPSISGKNLQDSTAYIFEVTSAAADGAEQMIIIGGGYNMQRHIQTVAKSTYLNGSQYKKILAGVNAQIENLSIAGKVKVASSESNPLIAAFLYSMDNSSGITETPIDVSQQIDQLNDKTFVLNQNIQVSADRALVLILKKPAAGTVNHSVNWLPLTAVIM